VKRAVLGLLGTKRARSRVGRIREEDVVARYCAGGITFTNSGSPAQLRDRCSSGFFVQPSCARRRRTDAPRPALHGVLPGVVLDDCPRLSVAGPPAADRSSASSVHAPTKRHGASPRARSGSDCGSGRRRTRSPGFTGGICCACRRRPPPRCWCSRAAPASNRLVDFKMLPERSSGCCRRMVCPSSWNTRAGLDRDGDDACPPTMARRHDAHVGVVSAARRRSRVAEARLAPRGGRDVVVVHADVGAAASRRDALEPRRREDGRATTARWW